MEKRVIALCSPDSSSNKIKRNTEKVVIALENGLQMAPERDPTRVTGRNLGWRVLILDEVLVLGVWSERGLMDLYL